MREAIPPLPHMPPWCGAQLKQITVPLPLPLNNSAVFSKENI
jgi:hypothetical protein